MKTTIPIQIRDRLSRVWWKLRFTAYRMGRFFVTLIRKRRFSDAIEAADKLVATLHFFDRQRLELEVQRRAQSFAYLLEPTFLYLQGRPNSYFTSDEELYESWLYALDYEETHHLLELYQKLGEVSKQPKHVLRLWMKYLTDIGAERLDTEEETVRMSPEVRRRYDNTIGLSDGDKAEIQFHPWRFGSTLLSSGMLKRGNAS